MLDPTVPVKDSEAMSGRPEPDFIEKRFHWGLCYGLLDRRRMASIIVEGTPEARAQARKMLAGVPDGQIYKDEYTRQIEARMREWEIEG